MNVRNSMPILMGLFVILMVAGTAIAVHYKLPAELDCSHCRPDTVFEDSFTKGTAITPPVIIAIPYVLSGLLVQRKGLPGVAGNIGLFVVSSMYIIASILEPALDDIYLDALDLKASGFLAATVYTIGAGVVLTVLFLNIQKIRYRFHNWRQSRKLHTALS